MRSPPTDRGTVKSMAKKPFGERVIQRLTDHVEKLEAGKPEPSARPPMTPQRRADIGNQLLDLAATVPEFQGLDSFGQLVELLACLRWTCHESGTRFNSPNSLGLQLFQEELRQHKGTERPGRAKPGRSGTDAD